MSQFQKSQNAKLFPAWRKSGAAEAARAGVSALRSRPWRRRPRPQPTRATPASTATGRGGTGPQTAGLWTRLVEGSVFCVVWVGGVPERAGVRSFEFYISLFVT